MPDVLPESDTLKAARLARGRFSLAARKGKPTPAEIVAGDLPGLYETQARIVSEAARFNVLDIGRRADRDRARRVHGKHFR